MSYEDYRNAQKLGMKAYKACVSHGKYPYLPALDEILAHVQTEHEEYLGISEVSLQHVAGAAARERAKAFASNYMPLLEHGSEFATKWRHLFDAQMDEGIRDPVKLYEYMHRYYVVEGNKRVSVLKYLDCPNVSADITRIVPKWSDDFETRAYYEYMDFHAASQINYVHFSKPGRYAQLSGILGKAAGESWTQDERNDFAALYTDFEKAFAEMGGLLLEGVTAGDALLLYLAIYPYRETMEESVSQFRENLEKMWPEIVLLGKDDSVVLSMEPALKKKTAGAVFSRIRPSRKRRAAFVYDKSPEASGWIYGHELGRHHLQERFGNELETTAHIVDSSSDSQEILEQLCREDADVIFAVTPELIRACLKAAVAYPKVNILNCALNSSYNTVRTYYTRMYEAKFLTGVIAGAMTDNAKIGYIADFPLYGDAAGINAFALGAKMVNPKATVYLAWSTVQGFDVDEYFREQGVFCISGLDTNPPSENHGNAGLYKMTDFGRINLATPVYKWGIFYERLIKSFMQGSFQTEEAAEDKAINYWWGFSAGVIDIICSEHVPKELEKLVNLIKNSISRDMFNPLTGPLVQQGGRVHYSAHEEMKPEDIMRMDWLVDNVTGRIPTVAELKEEAQPVVMLKGLYAATADKGGNTLP